jgi:hypothetical protein
MNKPGIETADSDWRTLYKVSSVAVLLSVAVIPISIVAYFVWPPFPGNALVIFTLIQSDRLAGIMSLDFLYLATNFLLARQSVGIGS